MLETEVEKIKKKVNRIYENYGLEVDGMAEEEMSRVYRYYIDEKKQLEKDLKDSEKHATSVDNDKAL
jgi:hypothetical protein|tara:strand:+ start:2166 stop:2366 length:201 start_codon:yes stop_codon:yes gene_type:complete